MSNSLSNLVNRALPAVSNSSVTYNASKNMFLTSGYTSGIGHTYFQGIQLSDRVAVVYSIGQGGWGSNPLFLNEVTVYCFDGRDKKIIGRWSPSSWEFYSDTLAQNIAAKLLFDYLKSQMMIQGIRIDDSELTCYAKAQIAAAVTNRQLPSA